ncbi:hypothetical protein VNO77_37584 [Canavalia gladiata]|uniref:Uncharacterized protein n=1 Tax=Canavalia gladiata TaxID=3824 RepID=A0AAN9KAP1_CANGL
MLPRREWMLLCEIVGFRERCKGENLNPKAVSRATCCLQGKSKREGLNWGCCEERLAVNDHTKIPARGTSTTMSNYGGNNPYVQISPLHTSSATTNRLNPMDKMCNAFNPVVRRLIKSYACYLSTSARLVIETLCVSTKRARLVIETLCVSTKRLAFWSDYAKTKVNVCIIRFNKLKSVRGIYGMTFISPLAAIFSQLAVKSNGAGHWGVDCQDLWLLLILLMLQNGPWLLWNESGSIPIRCNMPFVTNSGAEPNFKVMELINPHALVNGCGCRIKTLCYSNTGTGLVQWRSYSLDQFILSAAKAVPNLWLLVLGQEPRPFEELRLSRLALLSLATMRLP